MIESKIIYLLGIHHLVQWNNTLKITEEFIDFLTTKIGSLHVDLIAEEFSEEAKSRNNINQTTTEKVAEVLNIKHLLCDPSIVEREAIGYLTSQELREKFGSKSSFEGTDEFIKRKKFEKEFMWPIREKYWLDKIKNKSFKNIIFVCGCEHLESFKFMLEQNNYSVLILEKQFLYESQLANKKTG
ncbi:MAG: hypothetical protein WC570_03710 [Patescibacteria group bacterium]